LAVEVVLVFSSMLLLPLLPIPDGVHTVATGTQWNHRRRHHSDHGTTGR
jgi:hypothetical protein